MSTGTSTASPWVATPATWTVQRAVAMVERNMMMYRRSVTPLAFGLVEPVMYLSPSDSASGRSWGRSQA